MYYLGDTKKIIAQFTDDAGQLINPTDVFVTIKIGNTLLIDEVAMTYDSEGFYYYDYAIPLNAALGEYVVIIKGVFSVVTTYGYEQFSVRNKVEDSVWDHPVLDNIQSGSFGEAIARILGLNQQNIRMFNQVYDGSRNLVSCSMKIYKTASDVDTDTDPLAIYVMNATYDIDGKLTDYKLKES